MTEIGLKKCGRRLLSILTERYQINLKAFSKMLVAVILNTDSNESWILLIRSSYQKIFLFYINQLLKKQKTVLLQQNQVFTVSETINKHLFVVKVHFFDGSQFETWCSATSLKWVNMMRLSHFPQAWDIRSLICGKNDSVRTLFKKSLSQLIHFIYL